VAVGDAGDADHGSARELAAADRAADQRDTQGGTVDVLACVQQHPARAPPSGPVLNRFGLGQDAGDVWLFDADAADPVALGHVGEANVIPFRPPTA
jgi:hypothetical protein